jgi:hypothetical protein
LQWRTPESVRKDVVPVTAREKVLVALVVFCFTEAIRVLLHDLLPVIVASLLGL